MRNRLYGDGVHDDTAAIQEMIDTMGEVVLPCPDVKYLISRPLVLRSGCRLVLPEHAEILLAAGSNCVMLQNAVVEDPGCRAAHPIFSFLDRYSPDAVCEDIEVQGGIWNFNNKQQNPNPLRSGVYEPQGYMGCGFLFYNVRGLKLFKMVLKDPVNFSMMLDTVTDFCIENLTFDFNDGNPCQANMDGIHLNGNCHRGRICGLRGTCYDDVVALNAQEGSGGPISDIKIEDIETEGSYSAVRLLSASPRCSVSDVEISRIKGSFYHFGICLMRNYHNTGARGLIENINIHDVEMEKSDRSVINHPAVMNYRRYGVVDIERGVDAKNIRVAGFERRERVDAVPTVWIGEDAVVDGLELRNIVTENHTTADEMPLFVNDGTVCNMHCFNLIADRKEIVL